MKTLISFVIIISVATACCHGQVSKVYPMKLPTEPLPADQSLKGLVYHPEPILFVHGINANDKSWGDVVIPFFTGPFGNYNVPLGAELGSPPGLRVNAAQQPYLHTFNYGDWPAWPLGRNQQSFDHIEWNVLEDDKNNLDFPESRGQKGSNHSLTHSFLLIRTTSQAGSACQPLRRVVLPSA